MKRCERCLIPDTRPDTAFVEGICSACLSFDKRAETPWPARHDELVALLARHRNGSGYDCIVPSSGGKDSTAQVLTLLDLGARPLVVTATTCMLTEIGRKNIDNLARFATTIEVTPNREVRARLNRLGLTMVGDISWPEHVSIFTTPFRVACELGIPLIFYGENPQNQYGGPPNADEARVMTRRWVSEFGGFLGLRPSDLVGEDGLTERDLADYMPPDDEQVQAVGVEAHFLGQYMPWDSHENAAQAAQCGFVAKRPSVANIWAEENLDNAMTGLHDHAMYRKYGYGRACAQLSVDIRTGRMAREPALAILENVDGLFPYQYADVPIGRVLNRIGMSQAELMDTLDRFTNWSLFDGQANGRPILKSALTV
jgi:N-acetyl sugar amidotransferase